MTNFIENIMLPSLMVMLFLILVTIFIGVPVYVYASCKRNAELINASFKTNYTTWDMFVSGETILPNLIVNKYRLEHKDK